MFQVLHIVLFSRWLYGTFSAKRRQNISKVSLTFHLLCSDIGTKIKVGLSSLQLKTFVLTATEDICTTDLTKGKDIFLIDLGMYHPF